MKNIASLCFLAYKRPDQLRDCMLSLVRTIDYKSEIIINYDGIESMRDFPNYPASKIIIAKGNNRGVGRSFQNCLGVAEGDYIFKLDTDLIFRPNWLSSTIKILDDNPDIGAVGLFDYNRQDPNDERFKPENNVIATRSDCLLVKDFVSCGYAFRRSTLNDMWVDTVPDDGFHTMIAGSNSKSSLLALNDCVDNVSFGFKSVYVRVKPDGTATKTPTYSEPLIFGER